MNVKDYLDLLEANKNEKGIAAWKKTDFDGKSFGMGITTIKKLAKGKKKDNKAAEELWQSEYFDAKVLAILLFDPRSISKEKVKMLAGEVQNWMLRAQFVSVLLSKTPFLKELAIEYTNSSEDKQKCLGYLMLAEFAKQDKTENDEFYEDYISIIENELQGEENFTKDAMNNALLAIGSKNKNLNSKVVAAAENIGKVFVDYGDNSCEAVNVYAHLTSERIQKKIE